MTGKEDDLILSPDSMMSGLLNTGLNNPPPMGSGGKKRHFTKEEDNIIIKLVGELGDNQWISIANALGSRTARQVRDRWKYFLDPRITRTEWSFEEDQQLLLFYSRIGPKWSQMSPFFQNRSDIDIRNHWNKLKRQMSKIGRNIPLTPTDSTVMVPDPTQHDPTMSV